MKYSEALVNKICELIATDDYTINEICENVGISEATYHNWKNDKLEFLECIKKAENKRLELFKVEARKSTLKKITGFYYEDSKTVFVNDNVKEKTVTKKYSPPDTTMLIFVLKNTDTDNFRDSKDIEFTEKTLLPLLPDISNPENE